MTYINKYKDFRLSKNRKDLIIKAEKAIIEFFDHIYIVNIRIINHTPTIRSFSSRIDEPYENVMYEIYIYRSETINNQELKIKLEIFDDFATNDLNLVFDENERSYHASEEQLNRLISEIKYLDDRIKFNL